MYRSPSPSASTPQLNGLERYKSSIESMVEKSRENDLVCQDFEEFSLELPDLTDVPRVIPWIRSL